MSVAVVEPRDLAFTVDEGIAPRAAIGLVVLATDQTLEYEFRVMLGRPGVALHHSRIGFAARTTPDTLRQMAGGLADAAGLILPGCKLDVIAYGCTSATMVIGEEAVFAALRRDRPQIACTTPLTAAKAAIRALGARRIALITPYRDDINEGLRAHFEANGIGVPAMATFNEEDELVVPRIAPGAIAEAVLGLGRRPDVDMVFVSCTNLRLAEAVAALEAELGKPVSGSNHAMAWHCLRLAGLDDAPSDLGALFDRPLPV